MTETIGTGSKPVSMGKTNKRLSDKLYPRKKPLTFTLNTGFKRQVRGDIPICSEVSMGMAAGVDPQSFFGKWKTWSTGTERNWGDAVSFENVERLSELNPDFPVSAKAMYGENDAAKILKGYSYIDKGKIHNVPPGPKVIRIEPKYRSKTDMLIYQSGFHSVVLVAGNGMKGVVDGRTYTTRKGEYLILDPTDHFPKIWSADELDGAWSRSDYGFLILKKR